MCLQFSPLGGDDSRVEETQGFRRAGGDAGRFSRFCVGAEVAFISDDAEGAAFGVTVVDLGHVDGLEGAGTGTFPAAPAGIFVDDDRVRPQGDAMEGAGFHAARLRALLALDGFGDLRRVNDMDPRCEVEAPRLEGEQGLARMAGHTGGHAGLAADAEFRVCLDVFKHRLHLLYFNAHAGADGGVLRFYIAFGLFLVVDFFDAAGTVFKFRRMALRVQGC